jgi:hypothetical protein
MIARGTIAMLMASAAVLPLAGCDKAQTAGQAPVKKSDTKAWEGAQNTAYTDGYKAGDKVAWEAHLKARAERGQNEYSRTQGGAKK